MLRRIDPTVHARIVHQLMQYTAARNMRLAVNPHVQELLGLLAEITLTFLSDAKALQAYRPTERSLRAMLSPANPIAHLDLIVADGAIDVEATVHGVAPAAAQITMQPDYPSGGYLVGPLRHRREQCDAAHAKRAVISHIIQATGGRVRPIGTS